MEGLPWTWDCSGGADPLPPAPSHWAWGPSLVLLWDATGASPMQLCWGAETLPHGWCQCLCAKLPPAEPAEAMPRQLLLD